jgi:predicted AAA+ superfamily ATPase
LEEPGQLVELSELGELRVSRQTVSSYLSYLEQSFLVRKLYNYSTGRRKVERKLKRYYTTIISVDLLFNEDDLSKSRVFEWAMISQMGQSSSGETRTRTRSMPSSPTGKPFLSRSSTERPILLD